jgi:hypothetical protein
MYIHIYSNDNRDNCCTVGNSETSSCCSENIFAHSQTYLPTSGCARRDDVVGHTHHAHAFAIFVMLGLVVLEFGLTRIFVNRLLGDMHNCSKFMLRYPQRLCDIIMRVCQTFAGTRVLMPPRERHDPALSA